MASKEYRRPSRVTVWTKRCAAFLVWLLFVSYVFRRPLLVPAIFVQLLLPWDFNHQMVVYGGTLLLTFMAWASWGPWSILRFIVYVLFFPISLPLLLIINLTSVLHAPWKLAQWLWKACRSLTFALILLFSQIYAGVLLATAQDPRVLTAALILAGGLIALTLLLTFSWILSPTWFVIDVGRAVSLFYLKNMDEHLFEMRPHRNRHASRLARILARLRDVGPAALQHADLRADLVVLKREGVAADWETSTDKLKTTTELYEKMDRVMDFLLTPKTIIVAFVPAFISVFTLVVLGFGLIYLGAWRLDATLFGQEHAVHANYLDAVFFSITTVTTSGISELRPHTVAGKIIVSGQLLTGVTLLSLFVLLFSTLHSSDAADSRQIWSEVQERFVKEFSVFATLLDFLAEADTSPKA